MVDETVSLENLASSSKRDGTKNFVKVFDHPIGVNQAGETTNRLLVHTSSKGWVKSAYPF